MGIFDRFKARKSEDARSATPLAAVLSEEQLDELRETAREWIRAGFHEKSDLATELVEFRDDIEVEPQVLLRAATGIVEEEWASRLAEQLTWTGDSDYAKVQRAFDALDGQGIVARMNFTCCQTCGTAEIDDERTPLPDAGDTYPFREWGYTFFHQQDAERLADSPADLFLSYSVFRPAPGIADDLIERMRAGDDEAKMQVIEQSDVIVGTRVVEALRAEGLEVEWNGSNTSRVRVRVPAWRKPLPED